MHEHITNITISIFLAPLLFTRLFLLVQLSQIVSNMPEPVHAITKLGAEPINGNQQKNENTKFLSCPVPLIVLSISLSFDKEDCVCVCNEDEIRSAALQ